MSETVYYHGTDARHLYNILTQGFKLAEEYHGRVNGNGLYITTKPESVAYWTPVSHTSNAQYAFKCKLQTGTKILWKELNYNKKTIRSLEKEFGKNISRDYAFWKLIPHNKRLTLEEFTALVSHLNYISPPIWARKRSKFEENKHRNLSRLSKLVRQYGYDALGDRTNECWDSDEILVYNPSHVIPISVHQIVVNWHPDTLNPISVEYLPSLPLDKIKTISEIEEADWQCWLKQNGLE